MNHITRPVKKWSHSIFFFFTIPCSAIARVHCGCSRWAATLSLFYCATFEVLTRLNRPVTCAEKNYNINWYHPEPRGLLDWYQTHWYLLEGAVCSLKDYKLLYPFNKCDLSGDCGGNLLLSSLSGLKISALEEKRRILHFSWLFEAHSCSTP